MASPITDYATLRLNTADYIARDDLDQWFDVWLLNAESRLSSALKVPGMEKVVTAPIDGTTLTADLPTDYIEWMGLTWTGAGANAPKQTVRYVEINSPEWQHRVRPSGNPMYYTVAGQKIRLKPARAGSVEFIYYGNIAALTPGQTNYLITKAPHLYLAAVLAEAYAFQKDLDNAAAWMKVMDDRLAAFINESGSAKIGRRVERAAEDAAEDHAAKAIV